MTPRQKGKQWEISYRCPGYSKPISERFPNYEAAKLRIAEIEYEKSISELMDEYVQLYGLNHWGDSFLSYSRHRIEHYIKPYIGKVFLCDLTTHELDLYYNSLQDRPAVVLKGHKDTGKTISMSVIEKIHALLRNALNQAVIWGYIQTNPAVNVSLPKYKSKSRAVWTTAEAQTALEHCSDPILRLSMMLALGCSMRIGEILGLTWDCVDITDESIANGTAGVYINKELKRCDKSSLEALDRRNRSNVILTFPSEKATASTTSLVLKTPKTESSVRTVFLPETVSKALLDMKTAQAETKKLPIYQDYDLVIAHDDGRPYEERQIAEKLRKLIEENGLPPVVFHSLRHCSTSVKLKVSGGNIKAVQGDTGHAQARMVTDLYAHCDTEERRHLAQKVEESFFQGGKHTASPSSAIESDSETAQVLQLLQQNPNMAKLLIAAMQNPFST